MVTLTIVHVSQKGPAVDAFVPQLNFLTHSLHIEHLFDCVEHFLWIEDLLLNHELVLFHKIWGYWDNTVTPGEELSVNTDRFLRNFGPIHTDGRRPEVCID